jgi:cold shock protein
LATGRILQFDQARGYGFVTAEDGGEDVFLHASVFDGDPAVLAPGMRVKFQVMAGDRGKKAFAAHLVADEPEPADRPIQPPQEIPAATPTAATPTAADEEQMCDVLSQNEFCQELADLLLNNIPALTGHQILEVRQNMLEFAQKHGWVDN